VADFFQGEHATAYHVKGRGLVVITSCGHAGVVNSVRQIQKAAGIDRVHAVVGGFHLAPAPDEIVAKTVDAFRIIDPDYIIPMHCTGLNTIIAVHREMPTDSADWLSRYAIASAETRAALECRLDLAYGPHPGERLDVFPARGPGAPVHVFVHGGYWPRPHKSDSTAGSPGPPRAVPGHPCTSSCTAATGSASTSPTRASSRGRSSRRASRWSGSTTPSFPRSTWTSSCAEAHAPRG